ncbi:MAG TPA: cytochrome c [Pseudomonadales bacterium]
MRTTGTVLLLLLLSALGAWWWLFAVPAVATAELPATAAAIERGRYLLAAGGCVSCHEGTEHPGTLSGGLALESDFGTFFAPNITPDVETGIVGWSGEDFLRALKHGRGPQGRFYYPAFPYPSYAGMTDQDVLDIGAYLMSLPPVAFRAPDHVLPGWLFRWTIAGWNRLADLLAPEPAPAADPVVARGAYLARHLGHCGECHTPRSALGIPDLQREFAGGSLPEGKVEAIDAGALSGWTEQQFALFLSLGLKPDGDFVGGEMEPVIEHNTSRLTSEDQQALAAFFIRGQ